MCNATLIYQHLSREISESRSSGRRGGIAKRGEGSPFTTPTYEKGEGEPSYFQGETFYESDEDIAPDAFPLSPPLSPKTKAQPKAQPVRHRMERMRGHPRHRTSLKRISNWNPNLKQEFLRRTSIDSTIALFNEPVWLQSDYGVPSTRRRSSAMTTGARSISPRTNVDRRRPRKKSTLLHPSSPNIGPAADIEPAHPGSTFKGTQDWDVSTDILTLRHAMPKRKGSSLLHPSRPSIDVFDYPELKTVFSWPPKPLWTEDRRC
jgi:hypothetical protein